MGWGRGVKEALRERGDVQASKKQRSYWIEQRSSGGMGVRITKEEVKGGSGVGGSCLLT